MIELRLKTVFTKTDFFKVRGERAMKNRAGRYIVSILSLTFFVGLAAAPIQFSPAKALAAVTAATDTKQSWDSVVAAAKKEGSVTLYALWTPETRIGLSQAFKAKYGIDVEFTPFSRGAELLAKVQTEQRAGIFLADVYGAGAGTLMSIMKPAGVLGPIEPLLVLPETIDGKYWRGGRFPFLDKDKTSVGMIASVQRNILYNTDLIKKGEITTYKDLLKPQYKGKITLNDPTVSGSGKECFVHLALNVWNLDETKAYLVQLLKQQAAVIERDNRQHVESVARGKYAIGFGPNPDTQAEFLKLGSPIDAVILKEGVFVSSASGVLGVPTKFAHPHAAKLFINWLLGKEGQTVFVKGFGNPSLRNDVSTAQFNPLFLPQPQEKLFMANEAAILFTDEITKVTKQIIEEAYK